VRSTDGCCITKCPFITLLLHEFFTPSYGTLTGMTRTSCDEVVLLVPCSETTKCLLHIINGKRKLRQRLLRTGISTNGISAGNDGCSMGIVFSLFLWEEGESLRCVSSFNTKMLYIFKAMRPLRG